MGDNGNRLQHEELSGRVVDYAYDDLYRIETETVTDPVLGNRNVSWTYDAVGNRRTQLVSDVSASVSTSYVYDGNDRLTSEASLGSIVSNATFDYDNNGNNVSRTIDGVSTSYTYNSRNHLTGINNGQTTYRYDSNGIRMSETSAGVTLDYLVDPNSEFAQVIEESFDSNMMAEVEYVYGHDLVSQIRLEGPSTSSSSFYHYDGIGSTRLLSNSLGQITDAYTFRAFGELEAQSGTTANSYLFTGEQWDAAVAFSWTGT